MLTLMAMLILLAMPSTAMAQSKMQMDPNTLGALLAALLTTLGGGGWYLQRQTNSKSGRDELSVKTKAAIARDNADRILREKIHEYNDGQASMRNDLQQMQLLVTRAIQTAETAREEVRALRDETSTRFREASQANQLERLLQPLTDLETKLTRAIEMTERKGGKYGGQ